MPYGVLCFFVNVIELAEVLQRTPQRIIQSFAPHERPQALYSALPFRLDLYKMVTKDKIKTNNLPILDKIKTNKLLILVKIKIKTATKIQKIIDKSKSYGVKSVTFLHFRTDMQCLWAVKAFGNMHDRHWS